MEEIKKKKTSLKVKNARLRWARILVQLIFLCVAPALFSQGFAGAKNLLSQMGSGELLTWTSFTATLVILLVITFAFGRIFCGWACAFGALNDWVYQISQFVQKKVGKKLPTIPEKYIPYFQKFKYVTLFAVLALCFVGSAEIITAISPWTVFSLITALNFGFWRYPVAVVFLLILIVGMCFHERFFCQFFCPLGAIFSLLPELTIFSLYRDEEECLSGCNACKKNCPVDIKLEENPLSDGECIRCGRCMLNCPKKNIALGIKELF